MSRIIVAGLFFLVFFVGVLLSLVGIPVGMAMPGGFVVTGAALLVVGSRPSLRATPVSLPIVGGVFVAFGALLFVT